MLVGYDYQSFVDEERQNFDCVTDETLKRYIFIQIFFSNTNVNQYFDDNSATAL